MYPTTKNIVLGAGHIYFDEFDAAGALTGERYLAETPGFSMTVATEKVEDYSSDGEIAEKHFSKTTKVTRDFSLSLKDVSASNVAMFIIGTSSTQSTTSGAVTGQAINGGNGVLQGRWYQIGVSASQPTGVRDITTLAIKDDVPTTYTLTDDYIPDLVNGRIYIVPGGAIADDTVITADYTKQDRTWEEVTSHDTGPVTGALRYVAKNTGGANKDVYLPSVTMEPNGEFAFKSRDTVQQMGFNVLVATPDDGRAAVYVNGRAA